MKPVNYIFIFSVLFFNQLIYSQTPSNIEAAFDSGFQENDALWKKIDSINSTLKMLNDGTDNPVLENTFKMAVEVIGSMEFSEEFEKLRSIGFETNDFTMLDKYVNRCKPAIVVLDMGESVNGGVNINFFLSKCKKETNQYKFYELAENGFYTNTDFCKLGTAEFPKWIERTESSFQGEYNSKIVQIYLEKWILLNNELAGYYKAIAEATISCLKQKRY